VIGLLAGAFSSVGWNRWSLMDVRSVTASAASDIVWANQVRTAARIASRRTAPVRRKCIELSINLKFGRQNSNTARKKALFREKLVRSRKFALPDA
jgi:hypothetical protein